MMRSLYSGVAGLKTHQTRMDVIGNNIANVNTTAYKSQSMTFSDLLYQTTQSASGANPQSGVGGTNARQIGLGAKTAAIKSAITSQGASQTTNDPFDLMITGDNFFVVSNGSENFFTRDGSFYVDGVGNLCMTSTGYNVMGWLAETDPATGKIAIKQDTVKALKIMSAEYQTYAPEATSKAQLAGIIDSKDSNVNTSTGKTVTLDFYDNLGFKYTGKFAVSNVNADGSSLAEGHFNMSLVSVTDSKGTVIGDATKYAATWPTADLEFDTTTGLIKSVTPNGGAKIEGEGLKTLSLNVKELGVDSLTTGGTGSVFNGVISIDATTLVNFNNNGASTVTCTRGDGDGDGSGRMLGQMSGVSIQKDGMIYATYDNGMSRLLGQIATAAFSNPSGLEMAGDNLYRSTQNSGEFNGVGVDITAGGGYMNSGVLEMSNVDLSSEFTQMITTQRGFQANSRIITVSDTLLEELTNLKR